MHFVEAINAVHWQIWLMLVLAFLVPKLLAYFSPKGQLPLRLIPALNDTHNNIIAMVILAAAFGLILTGHNGEGFMVLGTKLLTLSPSDSNKNPPPNQASLNI
jgi:hypothetical protein